MATARWRLEVEAQLQRQQFGPAAALCERWLAAEPQSPEAHFLGGMAAAGLRRFGAALQQVERAIALDGNRAEYQAQRARLLSLGQNQAAALQAAEAALSLTPIDALSLDTLGVVFSRANDHVRAARLFAQAAALAPEQASYQFNLASALKFLGEFEQAEAAYEACIVADPRCWKAYPALSQLRRQTPERNHLQRYLQALPMADSIDARLLLRMALAKEYEDLGDPRESLRQLQAGKDPKRAGLGYRFEQDLALFSAVRAWFGPAPQAISAGGSTEPIFVVGMPRTGTTLVERILSSHSQVHSAGELRNFGLQLKQASGSRTRQLLDEETLRGLRGRDLQAVGEAYIRSTRPATGHTAHFIDKLPLNFLYAGFIALALPQARIICLRRNPLDTCLSNFRQLFALEFSHYNYAYNLLDTGRYYLQFSQLLQFWQQKFPGRILEVGYEALVAAPEAETRHLLDWCGLPWEDACLHFERNAAPVSTASAVQVRQPIYASSVNRWKQLEAELQPLRELLVAGGIAL